MSRVSRRARRGFPGEHEPCVVAGDDLEARRLGPGRNLKRTTDQDDISLQIVEAFGSQPAARCRVRLLQSRRGSVILLRAGSEEQGKAPEHGFLIPLFANRDTVLAAITDAVGTVRLKKYRFEH